MLLIIIFFLLININEINAQSTYLCTYAIMTTSICCNNKPIVELANDITAIPIDQFYDCSSLQVITIPSTVTSIG